MGENSAIQWTDHTFNPWIGCTHVSEGCRNCYAETLMDKRYHKVEWGPGKPRVRTSPANWKQPLTWNHKAERDGTRPQVFCASLADWLDPEVPIDWLADLLELIHATPHLDWLLLTKRPERWAERLHDVVSITCDCDWLASCWLDGEALPNVWIGTSIEDQKTADERIQKLLEIPARVRFLSAEPLLGPVDIEVPWKGETELPTVQVDWVICGGESGPNARPMHPDWARSLRDQCAAADVPFFFKQWGGVDKKAAGRLLDGLEHNAFPEGAA